MAFRGSEKADRRASLQELEALSFEMSFIAALKPGIKNITKHKQKVAVNAGACDAEAMARRVQDICVEQGTSLKVAWITGDDVCKLLQNSLFVLVELPSKQTGNKLLAPISALSSFLAFLEALLISTKKVTEKAKDLIAKGENFPSLPSDTPIAKWGLDPVFSQCYLGGVGICEALKGGADIVICGRVSDASPVIGAAMWWHEWSRNDFDKLAHALIAGHLIECSAYITGGSFTGFKKDLVF